MAPARRRPDEWVAWHRGYSGRSALSRRLTVVRRFIRAELDRAPPGPIRVLSLCAGDGRDLIGALADHPRAADVSARLIERDPRLVAAGRRAARDVGVGRRVRFRTADAGAPGSFADAVPADLVLLCGIFGNISNEDVRRTILAAPTFGRDGTTVVWTRGRFRPDLTPTIRRWFVHAGFTELGFVPIRGTLMAVGAARWVGPPTPFRRRPRLFRFLPPEQRPSHG
jgi:Putative methyltransferase